MHSITRYFADFTEIQKQQFEQLLPLYKEWNEKINVISRKDMDNFYIHHVLHSLSIATTFSFEDGMEILDLGCGGGFPGIPLAIFFPNVHFHMVDSINKKLLVVSEVAAATGLTNITVQHTRVEEIKNRKFDTVVSRAVAPLKELWQWSKPLLKRYSGKNEDVPNGLICLKGGDLTREIQESGCKPYIWELEKIFEENHFKEKFMLYQPFK